MKIPTPEEVRAEFTRDGLSIAEWARSNGFYVALVYWVLSGKRVPLRGQSHNIAVALTLKEGEIGDVDDLHLDPPYSATQKGYR